MTSMAFALSPVASAQYKWGDCLKVTRLSDRPSDSVLVISVEDTCRHRTDTVFVAGGKVTGDYVLAAGDASVILSYGIGVDYWTSTFRIVPADTISFLGIAFYIGVDTIWTRTKVIVPDTIRIVATGGAGGIGDTLFLGLGDTPNSYTGQAGKLVAVNAGETALEFIDAPTGSGASTFTGLTDTPADYTGKAGQIPFVNAGETALEFKAEVGGGIIDTSAMFTDDMYQNVIGTWSGDTMRIQLVEWSRPVSMVHPSLVLDTTALAGIYKSIATLLIGYKKYRVVMSLQANTTCYMTLMADTANGLSIHSLTYEWTLASANISGDERLSRAAGGVRMETVDTEVTNTNIWNQSTAPTITVDQTDPTNNANGIRYPLDLSTRRYSVGQFPIRFLPSSGPRVVTGYIWLWFTKDKSVATASTFDAYIQHNP